MVATSFFILAVGKPIYSELRIMDTILSSNFSDTTPEPPTGVPTLGQIWPRGNRTISSGGGTESMPVRTTTAITTASLANNAQETGTKLLAKSYRLLKIETNVAARVRLYSTVEKRDADLARAAGTDPTGDHGLMFDFVTVVAPSYGANQSGFGTTIAGASTDSPGSYDASVGNDITLAAAGRITAIRFWRGTVGPTSRGMKIWSSSGVELASGTTSAETGPGWVTVTLASPLSVTAGQKIRVALDAPTGSRLLYTQPGANIVSGDVTITALGFYKGAAGFGLYPDTQGGVNYLADVVFQTVTSGPSPSADISPTVDGFDGKATPDGLIPYTITNLSGSTGTVTATLTWISTE